MRYNEKFSGFATALMVVSLLVLPFALYSKKKTDSPRADIKVSYNYHKKYVRGTDGIVETDIPFILLANPVESKFFNRKTEYKDSLQSTPSGKAIAKQIFDEAFKKYWDTKDLSMMDAVVYKTQLYVFKSKIKNEYCVYDYVGMTGNYYYTETLDDIAWEISDSTTTLLGYECVMASAPYHGRQWTVWFAPEIPVQDGPWKLHGLPGLILEAYESSGQHHFLADGLEESDELMAPIYDRKRYDRTSRIEMLKMERNSRENGNAMINAQIGLNLGPDAPVTDETKKYDFLETDYH